MAQTILSPQPSSSMWVSTANVYLYSLVMLPWQDVWVRGSSFHRSESWMQTRSDCRRSAEAGSGGLHWAGGAVRGARIPPSEALSGWRMGITARPCRVLMGRLLPYEWIKRVVSIRPGHHNHHLLLKLESSRELWCLVCLIFNSTSQPLVPHLRQKQEQLS